MDDITQQTIAVPREPDRHAFAPYRLSVPNGGWIRVLLEGREEYIFLEAEDSLDLTYTVDVASEAPPRG